MSMRKIYLIPSYQKPFEQQIKKMLQSFKNKQANKQQPKIH